jgi:hypothetical protein
VADREQMKNAASTIKPVNDSMFSNPNAICIDSFHSCRGRRDVIQFSLGPHVERKEVGVEIARVNLKRGAHSATLGRQTRDLNALSNFRLCALGLAFEFVTDLQPTLD